MVGIEALGCLEELDHKTFQKELLRLTRPRGVVISEQPFRVVLSGSDPVQPSIRTPAAFKASSCFVFVISASGLPAM